MLKGHPIGLKISKTRLITTEPPYHAQVWEYPPPGRYPVMFSKVLHTEILRGGNFIFYSPGIEIVDQQR